MNLVLRYKVSDKEAVVVILPELMVTKYDEPYYILELKDESENLKILVSQAVLSAKSGLICSLSLCTQDILFSFLGPLILTIHKVHDTVVVDKI